MTIDFTNRALYNPGAEETIIGSLLVDARTLKHVGEIDAQDFVDPIKRKMYSAIQGLTMGKQTVDLITVDQAMGGTNTDDLIQCMHSVPSTANLSGWIGLLKDCARRRRVIELGEQIAKQAADASYDTLAIVEEAREKLRSAAKSTHAWVEMAQVAKETYKWLERRAKGELKPIQSSIADLDRKIFGFFPGELTAVGGRPGSGKSQFGMTVALAAADQGYRVGFASLEMVSEQYGQRVLSERAMVNGNSLRSANISDNEWERIITAMGPLSTLPVSFLFDEYNIEDIMYAVQSRVESGEINMFVLDYMQLTESRKNFTKDYDRVTYVSKMLKRMTREFKIPVVALAQLGREGDKGMPGLKDFRDSGAIEQDADNALFLYVPESADDPWVNPKDKAYYDAYKQEGYEYITMRVAKQRQGQTGCIGVLSDPAHMRYAGIDRADRR